MNLSLDSFTIPCPDPAGAAKFYADTFGAAIADADDAITVNLHGVGRFELVEAPAADASFPRFVVTYILPQPREVRAVMDTATGHGAQMLKPAKKALFGSFSGVVRSPDGVIWKVAAASGKDTAPAAVVPRPTETTLIVGVDDPKASRAFYTTLGMVVDRDYGSKYIDFQPVSGAARFCLMQSPVLAKDVGVADEALGTPPVLLAYRASSSDEITRISSAVSGAGGRSDPPSARAPQRHVVTVTDPDGVRWVLTSGGDESGRRS